ncbi:MAG: SRPBCC family protein, partial [Fimbriiglobus sp.]
MPVETFEMRSPMPASADELFAWHARPGAFERLQPPWENVRVESRSGPFADGQRVTLRIRGPGPFSSRWVADHYGFESGRRFRDRQLSGPFAAWDHTHSMIPDGPDRGILEDHIEYRVPLGAVGELFGGGFV